MYLFNKIPYCTIDDAGTKSHMATELPIQFHRHASHIHRKIQVHHHDTPLRGNEGYIQFLLLVPFEDRNWPFSALHPPDRNPRSPSNSASILRAVAYASVDIMCRHSSSQPLARKWGVKKDRLQCMTFLPLNLHTFLRTFDTPTITQEPVCSIIYTRTRLPNMPFLLCSLQIQVDPPPLPLSVLQHFWTASHKLGEGCYLAVHQRLVVPIILIFMIDLNKKSII